MALHSPGLYLEGLLKGTWGRYRFLYWKKRKLQILCLLLFNFINSQSVVTGCSIHQQTQPGGATAHSVKRSVGCGIYRIIKDQSYLGPWSLTFVYKLTWQKSYTPEQNCQDLFHSEGEILLVQEEEHPSRITWMMRHKKWNKISLAILVSLFWQYLFIWDERVWK